MKYSVHGLEVSLIDLRHILEEAERLHEKEGMEAKIHILNGGNDLSDDKPYIVQYPSGFWGDRKPVYHARHEDSINR